MNEPQVFNLNRRSLPRAVVTNQPPENIVPTVLRAHLLAGYVLDEIKVGTLWFCTA